jgi:hypothetical protein
MSGFNPDWDKLEACQESLRDHMRIIADLRGALEDACLNIAQYGDQPPAKWLDALSHSRIQDDTPHIPGVVVDELMEALRPLLVARGYIHKDDIDPLLMEAQKCYSRDGFHEFAAKHWPDIELRAGR